MKAVSGKLAFKFVLRRVWVVLKRPQLIRVHLQVCFKSLILHLINHTKAIAMGLSKLRARLILLLGWVRMQQRSWAGGVWPEEDIAFGGRGCVVGRSVHWHWRRWDASLGSDGTRDAARVIVSWGSGYLGGKAYMVRQGWRCARSPMVLHKLGGTEGRWGGRWRETCRRGGTSVRRIKQGIVSLEQKQNAFIQVCVSYGSIR